MASMPLAVPMACGSCHVAASSCSKLATSLPRMYQPDWPTLVQASRISRLQSCHWAVKSLLRIMIGEGLGQGEVLSVAAS